MLFTSITLGSGFQGGEVTPLFVIGAALGHLLGVRVPLLAALAQQRRRWLPAPSRGVVDDEAVS